MLISLVDRRGDEARSIWWREANARARGSLCCTELNPPPQNRGKKLNHTFELFKLCGHCCPGKKCLVCQINIQLLLWHLLAFFSTPIQQLQILIVVNVMKRHSPCGWLPECLHFHGTRSQLGLSMSEHQDSGEKIHLTTEGNTHPKAWDLPYFLHAASQPVVTGNHVSQKKMTDASDDQIPTRWQ